MWQFKELERGHPERDPHEAEFFRSGSQDTATALVREVIQNSLDARIPDEKLHMKFTFGNQDTRDCEHYYSDLLEHLQCCEFPGADFRMKHSFPFLLIEDFGTSGLDGPIEPDSSPDKKEDRSNFYNFWWREGKSHKAGCSAGRWGLGKTVLHNASKLKTFWALTLRHDDNKELLMGKAMMKTHHYDGKRYPYHAYFSDDEYLPLLTKEDLEDFKEKFQVSRDSSPGLSIAIPDPHPEIDFESIQKAIILHYFHPIIKDNLVVEIVGAGKDTKLTKTSILEIALNMDWKDSAWEDVDINDLMAFFELVAHSSEPDYILLKPGENLKFREDLLGHDLEEIKDIYVSGNLLVLRVPVDIHPRGEDMVESYVDLYLKKNEDLKRATEFYIRSGITISELGFLRTKRVHALMEAEDDTMSRFLGDSETPAHTDWNERSEGFSDRYHSSRNTLRYVRKCMYDILNVIDIPPKGQDKSLLEKIFFVTPPKAQEGPGKDKSRPDLPKEKEKPKPGLHKLDGGFSITAGELTNFPVILDIRTAYQRRRGSSFTRYHPNDFDLHRMDITCSGGTFLHTSGNHIRVQINSEKFHLHVKGFDPNRDLLVNVREETK